MARSSAYQSSFLGGEWTDIAHGRSDDPRYVTALRYARNLLPSEEGAAIRRAGTQRISPTRGRVAAKLLKFINSAGCAFVVEATPSNVQFYDATSPVFTNDARTISTSSFAAFVTLGLDAVHGWSIGDNVMLKFPAGYAVASEATCRGRIFQLIAGTTGSTLVLGDDLGHALPLTGFVTNTSLVGATVYRVLRFTSAAYSASDVPTLRLVQAQGVGVLLANSTAPQALTATEPTAGLDPTITFGALSFVDGPYLDPSGDTCTVSGYSGSITVTASTTTPFTAVTDVGRQIRLLSQPAAWNAGTAYTAGQNVTDSAGAWWTAAINNTGVVPGTTTTVSGVQQIAWSPNPTAGAWAWGKITAVTSSSVVTVLLDSSISGMALISGNGTTMAAFQLGVFSTTTGFPTCGLFFEGRLYLAGSVVNRFDASVPNGIVGTSITFSPTDPNGNVTDASGISEVLNATTTNNINWLKPDPQGILAGTYEGEWLISASTQGNPITPTSIQAHLVTRYGSVAIEPAMMPMAFAFPQRYGRRVMEYLSDAFSQRFTGGPLNEFARGMAQPGIVEMDYQQEPVPIIWARVADGTLLGCTYRRISRFITEQPVFNGWHKHVHAGGQIGAICVLPSKTGASDLTYIVVNEKIGHFVELMQPFLEVGPMTIRQGWYCDSSPGTTINTAKCGFLLPSTGVSATGVVASAWLPTTLPAPALPAPGSVIPPAPAPNFLGFLMLKDAPYLNGMSALYNLCPPKTITNFSMSMWLYVRADVGALLSTQMAGSGNNFQLSQVIGQVLGPPRMQWITNVNGASAVGNPAQALGFGGQWVNLLMSSKTSGVFSNGNPQVFYANDTSLGPFGVHPTTLNFSETGPISTQFLLLGTASQVELDDTGGNCVNTNNFGAPYPNEGMGMIAGIAEVWISFSQAIDFSILANRRLFNCVDANLLRYAPCSVGANGQLPLGGTAPDVYLSGNPKEFTINRAKGIKIGTFNVGGDNLITENIDPRLVVLDSLPPDIAPVT